MRREFAVVLRDSEGAFLEVDRVFGELGLDIMRVSYNKIVDVHTCFVEVEGTAEALAAAERRLMELGLFPTQSRVGTVRLVEFEMPNAPGALRPALELIDRFRLNITYVNAHVVGEGTPGEVQRVEMGLYVEDEGALGGFIEEAQRICPTHLVPYDKTTRILDNNLFYATFAREMRRRFDLTESDERGLMVSANRIVQNLERTGASPFAPFDYLRRFAIMVDENRGERYAGRLRASSFVTALGARGWSVEPPCGATTWVLECDEGLLVVDSGYALYRDELERALRELVDGWDERRHVLVLTHGDLDHAGCCDLFDEVWATERTRETFRLQHAGKPDWRARNPLHDPYLKITNRATLYEAPDPEPMRSLGSRSGADDAPLARALDEGGRPMTLEMAPFSFEVWEGAGGHVAGETVLVDRSQRVCVSGDVFVNVHGETKVQRTFNSLAPFLMTSVDSVPALARAEREELFRMLGAGHWQVLGGHGALLEYDGVG